MLHLPRGLRLFNDALPNGVDCGVCVCPFLVLNVHFKVNIRWCRSGKGQSLPLGGQQMETSMKLYFCLFMNING